MTGQQHYTFGDTDLAAHRLRTLARVFEPSSRELLEALGPISGALALDLGCGLGYTTELVAQHTQTERVVGLDQSERLLERAAQERATDRVSFARRDVANPPFGMAPASLLYARFLLTHLQSPDQILRGWALAAEPGARLALEETAFMTHEHPAFPRYYALVLRMQAHYGQRMYIGRELETLSACAEWAVESSKIRVASLSASDMARLHFLNLQTWSDDAFARANYSAPELDQLGAELKLIADTASDLAPVSCGVGQLVLRRR